MASVTVDCQNCSNKFKSSKLYNQHLVSKECPKAGKSKKMVITSTLFQKDNARQEGVETVTARADKRTIQRATSKNVRVRCDLCMKMYKRRGLTQHLAIVHKCGYCGDLVGDREQHVARLHLKQQCQHCSQSFTLLSQLEDHVLLSHVRRCSECDETFMSENSLAEHVEDVHASEHCHICGEKLRIADNMMAEHQDRTHGIKQRVIKQFGGGMMFMMVSE